MSENSTTAVEVGTREARSSGSAADDGDARLYDCVIAGGGIAGLTAAWNLRDRDVLVLEAESGVGGRVRSEKRGDYWLSVGAHMFPEPEAVVGRLVEDVGLETMPINGDLLGMVMGGKRVQGGRIESYPFRLPLDRPARLDLVRAGLKMRRAAAAYEKLGRPRPGDTARAVRERLLGYLDDRSFRDFLGPLHPQTEAIFRTMAHRMTAETDEVAAGCMAALFAHVWSSGGAVLGRNMRGGSAELPRALGRELGTRVRTGCAVTRVTRPDSTLVEAEFQQDGRSHRVRSRYAVVSTPAYVTRKIISDLPSDLDDALAGIVYGPFVVGSFLTSEKRSVPWDDLYSLLTPDLSFTMFFNHANVLRAKLGPRQPGGVVMVYAGAGAGSRLMERTEAEIEATFAADLKRLYPEFEGILGDAWIQKWPYAQPYQRPGRSKVQAILERPIGERVFLASDYVSDWAQMESAAQIAREAAIEIRRRLRLESMAPSAVNALGGRSR